MRGPKSDTLGEMQDTSPEMQRRYYAHLGAMSSAERVARLVALTRATIDLAIAGIKLSVPDATPRMLTAHLAYRRYGRAVAERFFPDIFPPSA